MTRVPPADYDSAAPAIRAAFEYELRVRGRVTNMKRTLLNSETAYRAFMQWYPLWDEVERLAGPRAAAVFAHAISANNGCLLCTLYFRRALSDADLDPDSFTPTADERLLMSLGEAVASNPNAIPEDLINALTTRFTPAGLVDLVGFAGMMIATNVFNSALAVDIDEGLDAYMPGRTAQALQVSASKDTAAP